VHGKLDNPEVDDGEPRTLTITKAYWFESDADRADEIGPDWHGARDKGNGNILVHVSERGIDYADLHSRVTKDFVLRAVGAPDVAARSILAIWPDRGGNGAEFFLRVAAPELAKFKRGKSYRLVPLHQHRMFRWKVADAVTLSLKR
jgi:hypothetical protein